jgi:hypothetical protein
VRVRVRGRRCRSSIAQSAAKLDEHRNDTIEQLLATITRLTRPICATLCTLDEQAPSHAREARLRNGVSAHGPSLALRGRMKFGPCLAFCFSLSSLVTSAHADDTGAHVHVHVRSREPVIVERRESDRWVPVCSAPCDVALPMDAAYRINGRGVRPSAPFRLEMLARGDRVAISVEPASSVGHTASVAVTMTGAIGFVPVAGYSAVVLIGMAVGAMVACPLIEAFSPERTYGGCLEKFAVGLAAGYANFPVIWAPALVGAGLVGVGGTWLALSPPTRVTPMNDRAPSPELGTLPRSMVFPIVRATF